MAKHNNDDEDVKMQESQEENKEESQIEKKSNTNNKKRKNEEEETKNKKSKSDKEEDEDDDSDEEDEDEDETENDLDEEEEGGDEVKEAKEPDQEAIDKKLAKKYKNGNDMYRLYTSKTTGKKILQKLNKESKPMWVMKKDKETGELVPRLDKEGNKIPDDGKKRRAKRSKFAFIRAKHSRALELKDVLKARKAKLELSLGKKAARYEKKHPGKKFKVPQYMPKFIKACQFGKVFLKAFFEVYRKNNPHEDLPNLVQYKPKLDDEGNVVYRMYEDEKTGKMKYKMRNGEKMIEYEKDKNGKSIPLLDEDGNKQTKERTDSEKLKDRMSESAKLYGAYILENHMIKLSRHCRNTVAAETANPELITPLRFLRSAIQYHTDSGINMPNADMKYRWLQQLDDSTAASIRVYRNQTKPAKDSKNANKPHKRYSELEEKRYERDCKYKKQQVYNLLAATFGKNQNMVPKIDENGKPVLDKDGKQVLESSLEVPEEIKKEIEARRDKKQEEKAILVKKNQK